MPASSFPHPSHVLWARALAGKRLPTAGSIDRAGPIAGPEERRNARDILTLLALGHLAPVACSSIFPADESIPQAMKISLSAMANRETTRYLHAICLSISHGNT
ncbi:hypothetical protein AAL_03977 [Moelleriella libera RCEF 2490]|uniref:Uncharacterized protein n=1 Tax=Moelleriella libera RCEF 2490 TaxID=1081109 RepID=A0A168CLE5_9HYPO|nr:hypothetical protein AAL_03977 [Moelleriella libera RCEF 2490]